MTRLFVALLVGLGIATLWRRNELRQDTDRASKAIANAASATRSRLSASESAADAAPESEPILAAEPVEVATGG